MRLGNLETGLARQEIEADLDLPRLQVVQRVRDEIPADPDHRGEEQRLIKHCAEAFALEHAELFLARRLPIQVRAKARADCRGRSFTSYRIGGAYINPPSFHCAFIPRSIPIGPMFRSYISP